MQRTATGPCTRKFISAAKTHRSSILKTCCKKLNAKGQIVLDIITAIQSKFNAVQALRSIKRHVIDQGRLWLAAIVSAKCLRPLLINHFFDTSLAAFR